jgi:hypothetical protein
MTTNPSPRAAQRRASLRQGIGVSLAAVALGIGVFFAVSHRSRAPDRTSGVSSEQPATSAEAHHEQSVLDEVAPKRVPPEIPVTALPSAEPSSTASARGDSPSSVPPSRGKTLGPKAHGPAHDSAPATNAKRRNDYGF